MFLTNYFKTEILNGQSGFRVQKRFVTKINISGLGANFVKKKGFSTFRDVENPFFLYKLT